MFTPNSTNAQDVWFLNQLCTHLFKREYECVLRKLSCFSFNCTYVFKMSKTVTLFNNLEQVGIQILEIRIHPKHQNSLEQSGIQTKTEQKGKCTRLSTGMAGTERNLKHRCRKLCMLRCCRFTYPLKTISLQYWYLKVVSIFLALCFLIIDNMLNKES